MVTGRCPKCGEGLEIPALLKQFSCMYCGARLSPSELVSEQQEPAPVIAESEAQAAADYYRAHILETITNHKGIERQLNKQGYGPAIEKLAADESETFRQLNIAWLAESLTLTDAAEWFLNRLEEKWQAEASWIPGKNVDVLRDADKFTIAIFLMPMIRKLGLPCCEPFCKEFHTRWMDRFPKARWELGDYDTIAAGFKKKILGLCFITTAVCLQEGKDDHCAELTAFRAFRDGYLRACEDGPQLIEEYYDTAPSIVWAIEGSSDRERRYAEIREKWLEPCFADLQAGQLNRCKTRYTDMVRQLQKEYLR